MAAVNKVMSRLSLFAVSLFFFFFSYNNTLSFQLKLLSFFIAELSFNQIKVFFLFFLFFFFLIFYKSFGEAASTKKTKKKKKKKKEKRKERMKKKK